MPSSVTTHFLPTEQALNANSNANIKNNLFTCLTVLSAVDDDTTIFKRFVFCSLSTITTGTFTFYIWTVAHLIAFFTKSIAHFFLLGNPLATQLIYLLNGQQMIPHIFLIILSLLNIIEEFITIFRFPFSPVFNIPLSGLNFPVEWYFIPYRKGWYAPD